MERHCYHARRRTSTGNHVQGAAAKSDGPSSSRVCPGLEAVTAATAFLTVLCGAGKLYMVCLNLGDVMGFVLRQDNGPQLTLDFGTKLTSLPGGLRPSQVVNVVGILSSGESYYQPRESFLSVPHGHALDEFCSGDESYGEVGRGKLHAERYYLICRM